MIYKRTVSVKRIEVICSVTSHLTRFEKISEARLDVTCFSHSIDPSISDACAVFSVIEPVNAARKF